MNNVLVRIVLVVILNMAAFFIGCAYADDIIRVHVESVYDGDTFTISERLIPGLDLKWHVRIRGIDTPELRADCDYEYTYAVAAKEALVTMLKDSGDQVILSDIAHDKYGGRLVATVTLLDGTRVADALVSSTLARKYNGGTKTTWCPM